MTRVRYSLAERMARAKEVLVVLPRTLLPKPSAGWFLPPVWPLYAALGAVSALWFIFGGSLRAAAAIPVFGTLGFLVSACVARATDDLWAPFKRQSPLLARALVAFISLSLGLLFFLLLRAVG